MKTTKNDFDIKKERVDWITNSPLNNKELPKTKEELSTQRMEYENEGIDIANRTKSKDVRLKTIMFYWVIILSTSYLGFVVGIVSFLSRGKINLPESVVVTLLATTTTTIIGLPALILYSLFPKGKNDNKSEN